VTLPGNKAALNLAGSKEVDGEVMDTAVLSVVVVLDRCGQTLVTSVVNCENVLLRFVRVVTRTPAKAQAFCDMLGLPLDADLDAVLNDPAV
jgi:hypothetical protein